VDRQDSIDLLNATHTFPCQFTLKVIGKSTDDFVDHCVQAVKSVNLDSDEIPVSTRSTPKGKHTSVTLLPTIASAEQVLEVYAQLQSVEGVVMTM